MTTTSKKGMEYKEVFVENLTLEEGLDKLRQHASTFKSELDIRFSLLMLEVDGTYTYVERKDQPCYGELRTYGKDSTDPDTDKPHDLNNPFPDGTPVAVSWPFLIGKVDAKQAKEIETFLDLVLNDSSPWRSVLLDYEVVRCDVPDKQGEGSHNLPFGVVIKDTNFDPTILLSLMMNLRHHIVRAANNLTRIKEHTKDVPDWLALFLSLSLHMRTLDSFFAYTGPDSYVLSPKVNLARFADGSPLDLAGGTLRDRFAYNRKKLHDVFGTRNETLPKSIRHTAKRLGFEGLCVPSLSTTYTSPSHLQELVDVFLELVEEDKGLDKESVAG